MGVTAASGFHILRKNTVSYQWFCISSVSATLAPPPQSPVGERFGSAQAYGLQESNRNRMVAKHEARGSLEGTVSPSSDGTPFGQGMLLRILP